MGVRRGSSLPLLTPISLISATHGRGVREGREMMGGEVGKMRVREVVDLDEVRENKGM